MVCRLCSPCHCLCGHWHAAWFTKWRPGAPRNCELPWCKLMCFAALFDSKIWWEWAEQHLAGLSASAHQATNISKQFICMRINLYSTYPVATAVASYHQLEPAAWTSKDFLSSTLRFAHCARANWTSPAAGANISTTYSRTASLHKAGLKLKKLCRQIQFLNFDFTNLLASSKHMFFCMENKVLCDCIFFECSFLLQSAEAPNLRWPWSYQARA